MLGRAASTGVASRACLGRHEVAEQRDAPVSTSQVAALDVATRVPGGVVNLLSALAYHKLTDELPHAHAVWTAMRRGSQAPKLLSPRLELTWTAPRRLGPRSSLRATH